MIEISIIIVSYNTKDITLRCLESIIAHIDKTIYEVIVVDNGSSDNSVTIIENRFPAVRLIKNYTNLGFSKAVNQGLKLAQGKYLLLVNSDIIVKSNIFKKLITFFDSNKKIGIVGGLLNYPDGKLQISCWKFPNLFVEFFQRIFVFRILNKFNLYRKYLRTKLSKQQKVDWVTGALMGINRDIINTVGTLDETFFMYYEDTDLCYRAKNGGWEVMFNPEISATHFDAESRKLIPDKIYIEARKSQLHYYKKHTGELETWLLIRAVVVISLFKIFIYKVVGFFLSNNKSKAKLSLQKKVIEEIRLLS